MGISIEVADRDIPNRLCIVRTVLVLTCDGEHGLVSMTETFDHPEGFIAEYCKAMQHGWKSSFVRGERIFLGPCCSRKGGKR